MQTPKQNIFFLPFSDIQESRQEVDLNLQGTYCDAACEIDNRINAYSKG